MKAFGRRLALRGLGGLLVSLPLLEGCTKLDGLASGPAREAPQAAREGLVGTPAKRFIGLMRPNGVEPRWWYPRLEGNELVLNAQNEALEAVKQHLVFTRGVTNKVALDANVNYLGNNHAEGVTSLLTGYRPAESPRGSNRWIPIGGPSLDIVLAQRHAESGYLARVPVLVLGDEGPGSYSSITIDPDGSWSDFTGDLAVLFDSGRDESAQTLENARQRRASVLDGTREDFERLATRVSGEDKRRIQAHLESLRSIERRVMATGVTSCARPQFGDATNFDERRDLFQDMIVAAMACDATRAASLTFAHAGGGGPELPFIDVYEDIHELSHQIYDTSQDHPSHALFTRYHDWFSRKTARLIERLKATTMPGGGTLFDETVILESSEIGFDHLTLELHFLLAAGERTPFATGRLVEFSPRVMHTHLLVSVLHAFGHDDAHFGDPEYPPGDLDSALFRS